MVGFSNDTLETNNVRTETGGALQTGTTAADTTLLQAYDTNASSYTTFATLTANNPPTFDLSAATTIGGNPIGSGDVTASGVLTSNAVIKGGGTTVVTASGVSIDGSDACTGMTELTVDNLNLNGSTINCTAGDLIISANTGVQEINLLAGSEITATSASNSFGFEGTFSTNTTLQVRNSNAGTSAGCIIETLPISTGTSANSSFIATLPAGSTTADARYIARISSGQSWAWGLDNSDSDAWFLSSSATGTNAIRVSTAGAVTLPTSPLDVASGGTGATTLTGLITGNGTSAMSGTAITQYNVLTGGASNLPNSVAPSATSGVPLISQGASAQPIFGTATVAGGGTGSNSLTNHGVLVGAGTSAITQLSVGATGTVLAGSTGADPSFTATPTLTSVTFGSGTALNTYQQGTFTPGISFGNGTTGITYTYQIGQYTQIGNILFFTVLIVLSNKGSSTGTARITGFPITSGSGETAVMIAQIANLTFDAGYQWAALSTQGASGGAYQLYESGSSGYTTLSDTNFANNSRLEFSGAFFA